MKKVEKTEKNKKNLKNEVKKTTSEKKKTNIFNSISKYFKGVLKEVKRIKWTSSKDLVKYSIASIVLIVFFGLYFYGIDWIALLVRSLAK